MTTKTIPEQVEDADKECWYAKDVFLTPGQRVLAFTHRNYSLGMHSHDFYELNIVLRGFGGHYMLDKSFPVTAGQVFVIPPGVKHGYLSVESLDVFHILLHPGFMKRFNADLMELPGFLMFFSVEPYFRKDTNFRYVLTLSEEHKAYCFSLLTHLQDLSTNKLQDYSKRELEYLTLVIISHFCTLYEQQYDSSEREKGSKELHIHSINSIINYINSNYHEKMTLKDLAARAHLQREYFCRIFHKVTGQRVMDYLATVRLTNARELILNSGRSITDVAMAVGYYDAAHFSKSFKSYYGYSPSHLRK
jgi:AraC-like DNA-binding protein/mannose-6-phosphate isomerase-like protein (cupin superfamily)